MFYMDVQTAENDVCDIMYILKEFFSLCKLIM